MTRPIGAGVPRYDYDQWEYKVQEIDIRELLAALNSLGLEGWELVAERELDTLRCQCWFKRRL